MRDLPKGWKQSELSALADIAIGGTPSRDIPRYWATNDLDGQPWVAISDLHGRVIDCTSESITEAGIANSNVKLVKRGTVLMSFKLSLGRVAFAGCDLYTNEAIAAFLVNDQVTPAYLYYALPDAVRGAATDVAIKGATLNKKSLRKLIIQHPNPTAQEKIAVILSTIDTAIEKTEALIEKYQHIKAGLMHDLFTRGVLPTGQLRPPTASVKTPFGLMPKDWRLGSLLELADTTRQPILTGPFGADLGNNDFIAEGVPVLRIGNVQQGRLDIDDLLYVSSRKAKALSRYRIKEGDLLFARQGATTGRNALADHRVEGSLINYHIIRVALSQDCCAPLFVETAFNNEVIKRQIERDKGRGTREGINTAQLTSLAFPIAPLIEQRLISDILEKHNRVISTARAELDSLKMQKLGLMQDLLNGKVAVTVATPRSEALA